MKLSILSNINVESLISRVSRSYSVYKTEGYGLWVQEITNSNSGLYAFKPDIVFIILDGAELIKEQSIERNYKEIRENMQYIEKALSSNPDIIFFINNIDFWSREIKSVKHGTKERRLEYFWEEFLFDLSNKYRNAYVFDLKSIIEQMGKEEFYSRKLWYLGGMKFSMKAERYLELYINRYIDSIKGTRKKCLVLDLDNTLWGGVVGEVGFNGIELSDYKEGARYKDFQKKLKEIKELGIILAVVSKNNYDDAMKVIREHPHMVLKEQDFVDFKINWDLKSQNIRALSEELNITLDSIVFIDDNPVERESVKRELPEVIVPDFPEDTSQLADFASKLYWNYFHTIDTTDEDTAKTEIYRQNIKRTEALKTSNSYEDFLNSLDTKITIKAMRQDDIQRASQLTQKTNQFNLTTKRYNETELLNLLNKEEYDCFVANVIDKYGDNGMVSVIITKHYNSEEVEIDTFLLSCRVMGRYIEDQIVEYIEKLYLELGYKKIIAHYKPTAKNMPVKELFERLGYTLAEIDELGNKKYLLELGKTETSLRKKFGRLEIII
ncbi:HAD-IIIC family phosphatase [Acetivibrio clariflavus]|uniref:Subfamily IIIC HAD-superfamily phosphatase n=1 Tax=Acetivibrio clariflavus (strain DSM 19732 / NBRC 101661 / EBR45) TaxID=720554 RepID=G8LTK7_ACECE|nr:HAD-IIIC family phosphatase [Acetivibrio clariflavus]AEV70517.1 subfamily IIIC HAD-superfamily phosphatase [Acetivibrio clariflavus DSM 19732]